MESSSITYTKPERTKKNNNDILENIFDEYSLKRNRFNPKKPSPNMFNKKLQHRMKVYYNSLYTTSNSSNKY
jgi:hypothetical protein